MKILLDECLTKKLKTYLADYEIYTVTELKWSGVKNGALMELCIEYNFDILLTIDKNLMFQQYLDRYPVSIIVFDSKSSKIEDLVKIVPEFKSRLFDFKKHTAYILGA